jgi:fumarylpyruvate hydrolase
LEPCYFTKSARCITPSGSEIPYPPATEDYHHEIELVVALGKEGFELSVDEALSVVYGYACGLDMTRRDLQVASRESKGPWDIGKDFENSAVISPIRAVEEIGHPVNGRIRLSVNGELRQDSDLENLIWSVPEIIAHLSRLYRLVPGDLIYTGTPDGVGPVKPGESLTGSVAAVGEIELSIRS